MVRYITDDLEISSDDSDEEKFKSLSGFLINSTFLKKSIKLRVAGYKNASV